MNKIQKIAKLQSLHDEGHAIADTMYNNPNVEEWKKNVEIVLKRMFSDEDAKEFTKSFVFYGVTNLYGDNTAIFQKYHNKKTLNALAMIRAKIQEVEDWDNDSSLEETPALEQVINICEKFATALIPLNNRRSGKTPYVINDEYDMQDIFHSYLSLHFDDIVPEEPMPSIAGSASTIDFFLKDSGIGIELKTTVSGKTQKKIKEDIIQDMVDYQTHKGIKQLVFFIYDPNNKIIHSKLFERDLEEPSKIPAVVLVRN